MEKEDLQKIIEKLESSNSKEDAYFGIFQYGGGSDESYIKANKHGLELFAVDLLQASLKSDDIIADKEKTIYPLEYDAEWIDEDSNTVIQYIEPSTEKRLKKISEPYIEAWNDKAMKVGCISGLIIAAVSGIVGLITILQWIF